MGDCIGKYEEARSEDEDRENSDSNGTSTKLEGEGGTVRPKPDFETRWKDDIATIWARPIIKLPVHTDVPRLAKKITIKSDAGDFIFDGTDAKYKATPNSTITKMLLLSFAKAVDDKDLRSSLQTWDEFVPENGDTGEHLLAFFNSVVSATGETPALLVMKAIHQRIIFPAFYCLKDILQKEVGKFKDKRGSWSVAIHITDAGTVEVVHKKRQQAVDLTPSDHPVFEFDWDLALTINLVTKSIDKNIRISLSELEVAADVPADQRQILENSIKTNASIS
jgi:hypothetical protein